MRDVRIKVVRVNGNCNAQFQVGDTFLSTKGHISTSQREFNCPAAQTCIVLNLGRMELNQAAMILSCPDPGTGEGGNVLFELSPAE